MAVAPCILEERLHFWVSWWEVPKLAGGVDGAAPKLAGMVRFEVNRLEEIRTRGWAQLS